MYAAGLLASAPGWRMLRCLAPRRRCLAFVNLGGSPVQLSSSHVPRRFQRPSKERVFGFLRKGNQLIAVRAIHLEAVPNAAELLSKHARAARTPDLDLVVYDHGETLSMKGKTSHVDITKPLNNKILAKASSFRGRR